MWRRITIGCGSIIFLCLAFSLAHLLIVCKCSNPFTSREPHAAIADEWKMFPAPVDVRLLAKSEVEIDTGGSGSDCWWVYSARRYGSNDSSLADVFQYYGENLSNRGWQSLGGNAARRRFQKERANLWVRREIHWAIMGAPSTLEEEAYSTIYYVVIVYPGLPFWTDEECGSGYDD